MVTPELFARFPDAASLAEADLAELERIVRSTGFFRSKAKSLREMARTLVAEFGGRVPRTMDELLRLRGVARKTANVVLGTAYGKAEGVVVDPHVRRLSYRLGLTDETDPEKIERDLMELLPRPQWVFFGHALIWHGRRVCKAPVPDCPGCLMRTFCPRRGVA
jgi:endonuclease-3